MARFVNAQLPEVVQPFWAALQAGEFIADAAVHAGTYRRQGTRWVAACGGVPTPRAQSRGPRPEVRRARGDRARAGARRVDAVASAARSSVGGAFAAAGQLDAGGHTGLARTLRDAASTAFFDGFGAACLLAAGIAAVGAILAAVLIPAQSPRPSGGPGEGD
jgi:hypothetical protein